MEFHPALGAPDAIPEPLRALFRSEPFVPKRDPQPADWLAVRRENGQSFEQYVASDPNRPDLRRETVDLLPLGGPDRADAPPLETMRDFGRAFFQMPVRLLDPLDLTDTPVTERRRTRTGERQLLTRDLLDLLGDHLEDDAFCTIGLTSVDLYPDPSWNFVFGEASLRERVGVYSIARYRTDDRRATLLRCLKVMAHEIGHMFGLRHCVYFECLMNGTNNLPEADRRPAFLCPIDLRKLMWNIGFDPVARYRDLEAFYQQAGLADRAARARTLADAASPGS